MSSWVVVGNEDVVVGNEDEGDRSSKVASRVLRLRVEVSPKARETVEGIHASVKCTKHKDKRILGKRIALDVLSGFIFSVCHGESIESPNQNGSNIYLTSTLET